MKKKGLWALLGCLMVGLTIFLVAERSMPKEFSDIVPQAQSAQSCRVSYVSVDDQAEKEVTGGELEALLDTLGQTEYHLDGRAGSVVEGELYHLYFTMPQSSVKVEITDQGKLRIDGKQYTMTSDTVSPYLHTLLS